MKKMIGVVASIVELLTYALLIGMATPKMFGCGILFYPITAVITLLGVYLTVVSFADGYAAESKAASIGILAAGIAIQLGLFGVCGAIERIYSLVIAIGGFGFGQYIFALFNPIVKSHRPGSDFGS